MLLPLKNKTIKTLLVPIQWIVIEGSINTCISNLPAVEFFKAIKDGSNYNKTEYAINTKKTFKNAFGKSGTKKSNDRLKLLAETSKSGVKSFEAIPARVTSSGRFELLDGHHRAAQQIVNGATEIKIDIKEISIVWQELISRLENIYGEKKLYQRIEHPFFDDWDIARDDSRAACIINTLNEMEIEKRNTIDVGCCTGRLSRLLSEFGFSAYGFDIDPNVVWIAEYLNMVLGTEVTYLNTGNIAGIVTGCGLSSANVIVCMSVLHHYLWENDKNKLVDTLKLFANNSKVFFIDHVNEEDTALVKTSDIPLDVKGYEDWLKFTVGIKSVKLIGTHNERPMYACSNRLSF